MYMLTKAKPKGLYLTTFFEDKETDKMDGLAKMVSNILQEVGEDKRYLVVYNYCEPHWNLFLCTRKEFERCQKKEQQRDAEAYSRILGI